VAGRSLLRKEGKKDGAASDGTDDPCDAGRRAPTSRCSRIFEITSGGGTVLGLYWERIEPASPESGAQHHGIAGKALLELGVLSETAEYAPPNAPRRRGKLPLSSNKRNK
jgi:hypothetical protein